MKQIVIIHGGNSFQSYDNYLSYLRAKQLDYEKLLYHKGWKEWLAEQLPESDVLLPSMPNHLNAVYEEWSIYFEKILDLLNDEVTLIGHSLGAMFLAKYLQNNPPNERFSKLILIAGAYDDDSVEDLGSFRVESASQLSNTAKEVHLFHSEDDPVVPYGELAKYQRDLPQAHVHSFKDRGHFFSLTPTFPELLELINK